MAFSEVPTPLASALTPLGPGGGPWESGPSSSCSCCSSCGSAPVDSKVTATSVIKERTAMILGMNPHTLRLPRTWQLYLWPKRHHWVLVAQPCGPAFSARVVDDFVHNAQHCFNTEVPSSRFFLVYELLVEEGGLFLMLSVKPDFDPSGQGVWPLGCAGPMVLEELQEHAMGVVRRYRSYSYIGCNCQHFASDLALSLGTPRRLLPEDEASAVAHAASDGAAAFSAAGVAVAATAAVGAGCASAVSASAPCAAATMLGAIPVVLSTVAVTATAVGLGGGLALIGIAGGYKLLYDRLREVDECDQGCCAADKAAGAATARHAVEWLEDSKACTSACECCDWALNEVEQGRGAAEEDAGAGWLSAAEEPMEVVGGEKERLEEVKAVPSSQEAGDCCNGDCAQEAEDAGGDQRPRAHSADAAAGTS